MLVAMAAGVFVLSVLRFRRELTPHSSPEAKATAAAVGT
jgi:hypothetical protein